MSIFEVKWSGVSHFLIIPPSEFLGLSDILSFSRQPHSVAFHMAVVGKSWDTISIALQCGSRTA